MKAFFNKSGSKAGGSSSAGAEAANTGDTTSKNTNTMSTTSEDGAGGSSSTSKTKQTQTRRAQVRSAQIRHRQRKANHITELEREVGEYRELIAAAERAAAELRGENQGLRRRLVAAGIDPDAGRRGVTDWSGQQVTVTLAVDEAMGTPAFSISSALSDHPSLEQSQPRSSPYNSHDEVWLTMAQEETAINFILSLEHICWNHFHSEHNIAHRVLQTVTNEGTGHTLMASAYCMATAPESIYKDRKALPSSITPEQVACPSMLPPTPPEGTTTVGSSSSSSSPSPTLAWSAPRISLQNLRGLASSLNPGDLELTPVQAWFELADRYPVALLVPEGPGSTLATFKKELRGLVKCLHYGAVIEREAFESVVSRIMDPALWEMQQSIGFDFL